MLRFFQNFLFPSQGVSFLLWGFILIHRSRSKFYWTIRIMTVLQYKWVKLEMQRKKDLLHDIATLSYTNLPLILLHTLTWGAKSSRLTSMSGFGRYFDTSSLLSDATGSFLLGRSLVAAFSPTFINFWIWYCCFLSIGRICKWKSGCQMSNNAHSLRYVNIHC